MPIYPQMYAKRATFPGEWSFSQSPIVGPNGSSTLPSIVQTTIPRACRPMASASDWLSRRPPGSGVLCSGTANKSSVGPSAAERIALLRVESLLSLPMRWPLYGR